MDAAVAWCPLLLGRVIENRHTRPTAPAIDEALQQGTPFPRCPRACLLVTVATQDRLVLHELLPRDVGRVRIAQAHRPLLQGPRVDLGLAVARVAVEGV